MESVASALRIVQETPTLYPRALIAPAHPYAHSQSARRYIHQQAFTLEEASACNHTPEKRSPWSVTVNVCAAHAKSAGGQGSAHSIFDPCHLRYVLHTPTDGSLVGLVDRREDVPRGAAKGDGFATFGVPRVIAFRTCVAGCTGRSK